MVNAALSESADALQALRADAAALAAVARAAALIVDAFGRGGRVFSCGNGGSMCDAMHLAEELSGRFRGDRKGLPAQAISDPGHLSCVANDFGYDAVFARYLESHARAGDVLVAISTSGTSKNVLAAAQRRARYRHADDRADRARRVGACGGRGLRDMHAGAAATPIACRSCTSR